MSAGISAPLSDALAARLGSAVVRSSTVTGGDIHAAHRVQLRDGRDVFVKTNAAPEPTMFSCEASGLAWLAQAAALRTPRVLAVSDGGAGEPAFLALEWIESGARGRAFDEALGRGLAQLHRATPPGFGLSADNYIATLPQANGPLPSWPRFYAERRLLPQLARAARSGLASAQLRAGIERVVERIDQLCGPAEPPARLHGDLWGGNALCDASGAPVLIDPAVYGGHREVDLAMMRLFGGFGPRCFDAYAEVHPFADGHHERVALYQLYPLLVHVNLFGGSYVQQVERALRTLGCA